MESMTEATTQPQSGLDATPDVTIVVVPRERFSCTQESLESIYDHTNAPFKLVYVDGNSPTKVRRYLEDRSKACGFKLVRTDYYLSPNQARNIGFAHVDTKYLVFIDNDAVVAPDWLSKLVECAEATDAAVVGPLMCQDKPVHEIIHVAGGDARIWVDKTGKRRLREKIYLQNKRVSDLRDRLKRSPTEMVEFHCMLIRTSIFEKTGLLDEALLSTREHLDFCMLVAQVGGKVYLEPESLVTYVPGPPIEWSDLHFYMLRWSDEWELASLKHLCEKWDVIEDGNFQARYKRMGWRRYITIFEPLSKQIAFGIGSTLLARILGKLDHLFMNPYITDRHARIQQQVRQSQSLTQSSSSQVPASTTS